MDTRKRLLLINPANPITTRRFRRESLQPPLGLGIVAALTPPDWKVHILDENFNDFSFRDADLVGLTALTSTVTRAYEIAAEYRAKGIPTVLGGIHATLMADEASAYVDTVVTGEAEPVWAQILDDFDHQALKRRYHGHVTESGQFGRPRFELFHPRYLFAAVQTTRGCPMRCEFCSVPVMNNNTYRLRDVNDVLDELEAIPHKLVYFVDDNIYGAGPKAREHALELFRGMIDRNLRKEWFGYVPLSVGRDEEWIRMAAKSGCRLLLIGVESEKMEQLSRVGKKMNVRLGTEGIEEAVRRMHKYGISVLGSFLFGMENDTPQDILDRMAYMQKSPFDVTQPNIMTPFPGTPLFDRIHRAGKILRNRFPGDWQYFHALDYVYKPDHLDPEMLRQEMKKVHGTLFSNAGIRFRFLRTLWNTRSLRSAVWAYQTNKTYQDLFRIIGELSGGVH